MELKHFVILISFCSSIVWLSCDLKIINGSDDNFSLGGLAMYNECRNLGAMSGFHRLNSGAPALGRNFGNNFVQALV